MNRFLISLSVAACVTFGGSFAAQAETEVQEVVSKGGITAWLVEEPSIPFTALEIRFQGGTSLDREGKRGETNLMMATLEEGAADLDAQGFAKARDSLAAHFGFSSGTDSLSISARFLSENQDEALALLRTAIVEPSFNQVAVDRVRGQVESGIRSEATDPSDIASALFFEDRFGAHPYGTNSSGTLASIAGISPEDLDEARLRGMVKDRMFVAAVGDITAAQLGPILDELLGDLPQSGPDLPSKVTPLLSGKTKVQAFDTPQSVVMFGHQGITRRDEDFIPAYIASEILGGSRESRLMAEVREKRGLTYGIGTYLVPYDHSELVLGQFSSGNEVVGQAIDVVKDEWNKFSEVGITAKELEDAQTYLTGAYALRFDGNAPIASILVGMQMIGLERDYIAHRNDLVNAVTLEEINAVIGELYQPENLTFVVVGQPEGLKSE
jgi:zinc protease